MSIKKRLLIIDAALLAFLVFVCSFLLIYVTTVSQKESLKNDLLQRVLSVSEQLVDPNGNIDYSANIDYFYDNIYISVHKEDGTYITGSIPENYIETPLSDRELTEVDGYYYYDLKLSLKSKGVRYLRGIIPNNTSLSSIVLIFLAIIVPLLTIAAIILNYFLIKRALSPINELNNEVNLITSSIDFSKEIKITSHDPDVKQLETSFNKMLIRLKDLFESEEELTSDISHELRTPLSVILGETEYALECNDEKEIIESLKVILKESNQMIRITKELLEFQRMKNHDNISKENLNVSMILEEMNIINEKNIKLIKRIKPNIYLDINETLFIEMIQNLLDNASKYGKENGTTILELTDNEIIVSDDGIGIKKEDLNKIFMRFYQVDKSRTNKNSLGLGLAFVNQIAKLHNFTIEVESEFTKGSKFIIKFNK